MDLMQKKRLQAVLASYGADPARWPRAERDSLARLMDDCPDESGEARRIDALLALAPAPEPLAGFESRLMARIAAEGGASVLAFRRPAAARFSLGWAAIPLAASLALGIYVGAMGTIDQLLPAMVTDTLATADDDFSGITEVTDYSEDQAS